MSDEFNEHAEVTSPEAKVREINQSWYVELVVPHPKNVDQPPQSMTMLVPSKWCARFITSLVNNMADEDWEAFANNENIPFE